ncbi:MAG TPA: GNAT family N-acetyltransferase [Gammaproteobacteria bacterium]|nr:GNAT family N-acetyltransferase [Gammaproteobacteria bacterium]
MTVKISVSDDKEYWQIARAITKFNLDHLPENSSNNMCSLGYVAKDPHAGLVGGVYGKLILGNCLSVDVLWVDPAHRERDYGTILMEAIENGARSLGSRLSIVDTFEFQALNFYEKNGYQQFGVLDDCPCPGNKRFYLKKVL